MGRILFRYQLLNPIKNLFLRVHLLRYIVGVALVGLTGYVQAQDDDAPQRRGSKIIDDTTRQIYGPRTSRYYFEQDVFMNRQTYHFIDTAIRFFNRYTYIERTHYTYADLGNIGTSAHAIFYKTPDAIGTSSGFTHWDLYWDSEIIQYYDTKSPYTNLRWILGGNGRAVAKFSFSRNINPRWNFGFNYRTLAIDKQIQRQGRGDRNVKSTYYDLYTAFQSKDSTYRIFVNYRRNMHRAFEYGGIREVGDFSYEDYFDRREAQPSLSEAQSEELRSNTHLFHQYEIAPALQVYHILDRYRQGNDFLDTPDAAPDDYYDNVEIDSAQTSDHVKYTYLRNEVGIKGNLSKLFYNGYYAIRKYSMEYKYLDTDTINTPGSGVENYLGGRISLKLDSIIEVTGWAEVMHTGNFRIEGHIKSKWFEASLKQMQYAPGFLYQAYRGSHDVWNNNFHNVNVTMINGYLHYTSPVFTVSPGLTFTRLGNYVYLKEDDFGLAQTVMPVQASGAQIIASPELQFGITAYKHIHLRGRAIYTKALENSGDAIQIPALFVNGELSYENIFFNNNLDMHAGLDVHWQSDYYAMGYDVPTQQFYVQQSYRTPSFPLVDVFFSGRIKMARIFVKYNNLVQLLTGSGYMPTPYYPGQRSVFDFGFDWSFYD